MTTRAQKAIEALRKPDASLQRVPNTIRQSIAEVIEELSAAAEIARLIDVLRAGEGDSVEILCDNPDFNGQPNCAIVCCGDWTGWLHKRFAADTVLDALSMAMTERALPSPRKVIAQSNGHHWMERFNLVCCRDCGFVRRADDQNSPCQGLVGVGIRRDLLPDEEREPRTAAGSLD